METSYQKCNSETGISKLRFSQGVQGAFFYGGTEMDRVKYRPDLPGFENLAGLCD
jgi:hypothetical protein